jgi:hypothetical protein
MSKRPSLHIGLPSACAARCARLERREHIVSVRFVSTASHGSVQSVGALAVTAASRMPSAVGTHPVPLDAGSETMRQTGRDMRVPDTESSLGGHAVNVVAC